MEMQNSRAPAPHRYSGCLTPKFESCRGVFAFRILFVALLGAVGCGAPGEPTPPTPPIPAAITDLSAHQAGDGVQLIFSMPAKSVTGEKLGVQPAIEIVRGSTRSDGSPNPKSLRVVSTVPGALVANYVSEGHVKIIDPVTPAEVPNSAGGFVYLVRTRASRKRASADSNAVFVHMLPVPERIASVQLKVTESAIELAWAAPTRTSGGDPLNTNVTFRVYRGELEPSSVEAASKDFSQAKWKSPLAPLATTEQAGYSDSVFDFGKTYVYIVRSIIPVDGGTLESSDSEPAMVAPRDTFPPAAPQNLSAAVLPGATPDTFVVDLSWSINLETDLAGYHVYRSEQQSTQGDLVTAELLPAPAYRDTSVLPGRRYWYSVTAVDRAGNESEVSPAVAVEVPKPTP